MALSPSSITQAVLAAGPDLRGPVWTRLASVVGVAIATWSRMPSNMALQGATVGAVGSGAVTGKVFVVPAPLPVPAAVTLASLLGLDAAIVARAIGMGTASAFNATASYQGVSIGVGSGTDVSRVNLSNGSSLVAALCLAATSSGMVGVEIPRVMAGLGPGIAALLHTGTGIGVVAGPVGPLPGAGTSISRVF